MKILVVDDDPDMLAVTGFALQQTGYLVVKANSYGTAIGTFRAERPDCAAARAPLPAEDRR
ncbi:MAG: response regulator [Gammaproteobacteria bacterium]|jgi:two-component system OmpR family response regulator|nr:response regulator [Gammaproteobacteria bacterium]